jgi:uncharacterized membrane protein
MRWNTWLLASTLAFSFTACDGELQPSGVTPETETTGALTGFPCDVHAALQASCASCHAGDRYAPEFPTRDAFLMPATPRTITETPNGTWGEVAAARIQENKMPPYGAPQPTEADRTLLIGWFSGGMPAGACGALTIPQR